MVGYVYLTTNLVNNKKYIGKHTFNGKSIDLNYLGSGKLLQQAIKKYGKENFDCKILEWCSTIEQLDEREKYWIKIYKDSDNTELYNIAEGGTGGPILNQLSKEDKQKAMERRTETWRNNGYSERMSKQRRDYYVSHPEKKQEISQGLKEYYKNNPEAKEKAIARIRDPRYNEARVSNRKYPKGSECRSSRACICIETQEIFCSATEAAQKYGGSYKVIWKCCKNQCQTAAGFHWAFLEDTQKQLQLKEFVGKERKFFRNNKHV